jgi:DNA-binding MarR family transcriptional regulator
VGEIADALGIGQPSVSKHLRVLLEVGLVEVRRDGRQAFYRTNGEQLRAIHAWTERFERHWLKQLLRIKARAEARAISRDASAKASRPPSPSRPPGDDT